MTSTYVSDRERRRPRRENPAIGAVSWLPELKCLYLPQSWADDRDRCRQAGIADQVEFADGRASLRDRG